MFYDKVIRLCVVCVPQTEQLHLKMTHSQEDSLTAVAWHATSDKFVCGGARGQFYHCSIDVSTCTSREDHVEDTSIY